MAITSHEHLEVNKIYNFIPPEGEYPKCLGKCTVMRINGSMIGLRQEADKNYPNEITYDAMGNRHGDGTFKMMNGNLEPAKPREVGKTGWVKFHSYKTIE